MITTVSSGAALEAALKSAQAGDTIQLSPGVYALYQSGRQFDGVTITSADPSNKAIFNGIETRNTSGLTFRDLEIRVDADDAVTVSKGSTDIHFDRVYVHGSLDDNPQNDFRAFMLRDSSNISVTNSEFEQLNYGVGHLNAQHLTVSGNSFHDIRLDGVRGGGSNHVTITDNTFTDFYPVAGDHPDAIQFWTTNTTTNTYDILVANNVYTRGEGAPIQGIFFGDEVAGVYYERIQIEGNLISGGMYHGITLESGRNFSITDNVVQGYADQKSWIRLDKDDNGVLTGNQASTITVTTANTNLVQGGNVVIPLAADRGAAIFDLWRGHQGASSATEPRLGLSSLGSADSSMVVRIIGAAKDDTITGGAANDTLADSGGHNVIRGGDGADAVTGGADFDDLNGNAGADTVSGGAGNDWVLGGKDNDLLFGDAGDDLVYANLGSDTANGGAGNDAVRGGQGDDVLSGGAGNDFLSGDRGADTLSGGAGADTFNIFGDAGLEHVTDFDRSQGDRVVIEGGASYTVSQAGADTIIDVAGGARMVLAGVSMTSLTGDWIL